MTAATTTIMATMALLGGCVVDTIVVTIQYQWNLRTMDKLGTELLSFVERLSLSRRLTLILVICPSECRLLCFSYMGSSK